MTDLLPPKTFTGPSMGIPNHLVCCARLAASQLYSLPNVEDSIVCCRLLYHSIGVLFKNVNIPVCDILVTQLLA
jgi:hypothetical protein